MTVKIEGVGCQNIKIINKNKLSCKIGDKIDYLRNKKKQEQKMGIPKKITENFSKIKVKKDG